MIISCLLSLTLCRSLSLSSSFPPTSSVPYPSACDNSALLFLFAMCFHLPHPLKTLLTLSFGILSSSLSPPLPLSSCSPTITQTEALVSVVFLAGLEDPPYNQTEAKLIFIFPQPRLGRSWPDTYLIKYCISYISGSVGQLLYSVMFSRNVYINQYISFDLVSQVGHVGW